MKQYIQKQGKNNNLATKNNEIKEQTQRKETKYNHIVQLKDELVKMKQFLN